MDKVEFKKGDLVTFHPYKEKLKCKIVEVNIKRHLFDKNDNRIFYRLNGEADSITTGLSIVESIYYKR